MEKATLPRSGGRIRFSKLVLDALVNVIVKHDGAVLHRTFNEGFTIAIG